MSSSDSVREMDLVAVATAVAVAAAGRMVAVLCRKWLVARGERAEFFFPLRNVILERVFFFFCFLSSLFSSSLVLSPQLKIPLLLRSLPISNAMLRTLSVTNRPAAAVAVRPSGSSSAARRSSSAVVAAQRSSDDAPVTKR